MELAIDRIPSPIGTILLVADDRAVYALDFEETKQRMLALLDRRYGAVRLRAARNPAVNRPSINSSITGSNTSPGLR